MYAVAGLHERSLLHPPLRREDADNLFLRQRLCVDREYPFGICFIALYGAFYLAALFYLPVYRCCEMYHRICFAEKRGVDESDCAGVDFGFLIKYLK